MVKRKINFFVVLVFFFILFFSSFSFFSLVRANQLLYVSDVMSRHKIGALSNHTIQFTTLSGVAPGRTITIAFPSGFNLGAVSYTDIDVTVGVTPIDLKDGAPSGVVWGANVSGQVLTLTSGTGTIAANSVVEIKIGTNAQHRIPGDAQITNSAVASSSTVRHMIKIAGTFGDTATLIMIVLDDNPPIVSDRVSIIANVIGSLTFSIQPLPTGTRLGGVDSALTDSTKMPTAAALSFGRQTVDEGTILGQKVIVTTNTASGYRVVLRQNRNLTSGSNNISNFLGTNSSPRQWEEDDNPISTTPNVNTSWFGYTTADESLNGGSPARFGSGDNRADYWAGFTQSAVDYEIAFRANPTIGSEETNIGFKLEANSYQPAGLYSGTVLTYTCTVVP